MGESQHFYLVRGEKDTNLLALAQFSPALNAGREAQIGAEFQPLPPPSFSGYDTCREGHYLSVLDKVR